MNKFSSVLLTFILINTFLLANDKKVFPTHFQEIDVIDKVRINNIVLKCSKNDYNVEKFVISNGHDIRTTEYIKEIKNNNIVRDIVKDGYSIKIYACLDEDNRLNGYSEIRYLRSKKY
jgi:hypothetical protein